MKLSQIVPVFLLLISSAIGFLASPGYQQRKNYFNEKEINRAISNEIIRAEKEINILSKLLENDNAPEKRVIEYSGLHALYLFRNHTLVAWSTNSHVIEFSRLQYDNNWHFTEEGNVQAIYQSHTLNDDYIILYLIPLRKSFPYENQYLQNSFFPYLPLNNELCIGIADNDETAHPVYDLKGRLLFSIFPPETAIEREFSITGFIAFSIAFLLVLWIYLNSNNYFARKKLKRNQFFVVSAILALSFVFTAYFNFPGLFYNNPLFSTHFFAVNNLISSFTHLTVLIFGLTSIIYVYYQKTEGSGKILWFNRLLLVVYLVLFYETLKSLIIHSTVQFNIFQISDISFISLWAHLLVFLLTIGLYFLILYSLPSYIQHKVRDRKKMLPKAVGYYLTLSIIIAVFTNSLNEQKNVSKFKVLSGNIMLNGNSESDPIAELLIAELDGQLKNDDELTSMISTNNDIEKAQTYIYDRFLRGFRNQFDVNIYTISYPSDEYDNLMHFVHFSGKRINETSFYSLPTSLYDLSYLGLVPLHHEEKDFSLILVLEFQPKRNFRSFSFPDLLVNNESQLQSQINYSIAKYEESELVYSDKKVRWKEKDELFTNLPDGFKKLKSNDTRLYVNSKGNVHIVIRELSRPERFALLYYIVISCIGYVILARIFIWFSDKLTKRVKTPTGLTTRFQWVFISLLMMSFLGIFVFSVQFIRNKYQQEQIRNAENKKRYIQEALQSIYFWTENLNAVDEQRLNSVLEELAYTYQTDINVYSNDGILLGSSQSLVFSKQLISKLMAPAAFFSEEPSQHWQEKIGGLAYLSSYTEFLNGDFLRLGYIAIPQYLSQSEINAEIESYMTAITQLYLFLLLLSVVFIIIAGRQLSRPLQMLENKLKSMHWGGKNEKIDYKLKDEIGQLVEQYNRTVDELEKSTKLLLQTERETAWRTMARQVAHEINNPLTPMKLTIQQLQRMKQKESDEFEEYFNKATKTLIEQIDNLSRIAGTFSQFARLPETRLSRMDVADKLFHVTELFRNNHESIQVEYSGPEKEIYINGDPDQLIQVFNNILKNAFQAIGKADDGMILIETEITDQEVKIHFTDNGQGIHPDIQDEIFRPSFTTKSTGMGLGLSISKNIVEYLGGNISFRTTYGKGTQFTVTLPRLTKVS